LRSAGVSIPKDVEHAAKFAKFRAADALPGTADAEAVLAKATTEEEYAAAYEDLALSLAVQTMANDSRCYGRANEVRNRVLRSAIADHLADFLDAVSQRFDKQAEAFTAALADVPDDIASLSALDIDETAVKALRATKQAYEPLAATYRAGEALWVFTGWRPGRDNDPDALARVLSTVAEFDSPAQRHDAVQLHLNGGPLAAFSPFAAAVRAGGRLRLSLAGGEDD
jgi:hypothetical protein